MLTLLLWHIYCAIYLLSFHYYLPLYSLVRDEKYVCKPLHIKIIIIYWRFGLAETKKLRFLEKPNYGILP